MGETLNTGIGQGYVLTTPLQLATLAARIASGRAVTPRIAHMVGTVAQPRPLADPLPFSDEAFAAVREGMNAVCNEGGTASRWRIAEPGMEMAGKTGTAQVRVITKQERSTGVLKDTALPWQLRDHGLFIAFAPGRGAALCRSLHRGARRARPSPGADRARRSAVRAAAQPARDAHRLSDQCRAGDAPHAAGRSWMTTRPYAAMRRTLSVVDKLYEVNWGMVLLITIVACVGFAMLYSVAGGSLSPWATPQILRFLAGFAILVAASVVDIRTWLSLAYPAYGASLVLLIGVVIAGHVGKGAEALDHAGAARPAAVRADEGLAGAGACALPARQERRGHLQARQSRLALAMIGIPAVFVVLQPNLGTTLIILMDGASLCSWRGCRGGGSRRRSPRSPWRCRRRGSSCCTTTRSAAC